MADGSENQSNNPEQSQTPVVLMSGKRDAIVIVEDGFTKYESASKRSRKTSAVWNDFGEITSTEKSKKEGVKMVRCNHCKGEFTSGPTYGTTHLKRHLKVCKAKGNQDLRQMFLEKDGNNAIKNYKYGANEVRRCILLYVIQLNHSFSIVEHKAFRRMVTKLNPQFVPFGRLTLKNELLAYYVSERDKLKISIENAIGRVCLTTDNWKSEHARVEYICVTAHYVDKSWKLQKRILRFKKFDPSYGGIRVADELLLCMSQWNIEQKIFSITNDNASYNDVMICNLKLNLNRKKCLLKDGKFLQVRCCAHILNLIVQAGLAVIEASLDNICEMVKCVRKSTKRSKSFFDVARKNFDLETRRRFRLDMPVRGNSTYFMLDRVLYYKNVFLYFVDRDQTLSSYIIKDDEWENVSVIHKLLKPFYEVTCMFSAIKTPTANLYFKCVWKIHKVLSDVVKGEPSILSDVVESMQSKFDKYWSEYNEIFSCACILDPRYKKGYLQYAFDKLYDYEESEIRVTRIISTLYKLFDEYNKSNECDSGNSTKGGGTNIVRSNDDFEFSKYLLEKKGANTELELDGYLSEPLLDSNEPFDIFEFWNKSSVRYPNLSRMAADLLCIPVSSVASESAFSIGGKVITATRSSLDSKTVQAIICLNDWLKDEVEDMSMDEPESSDDSSSIDEDIDETLGLEDFF